MNLPPLPADDDDKVWGSCYPNPPLACSFFLSVYLYLKSKILIEASACWVTCVSHLSALSTFSVFVWVLLQLLKFSLLL